MGHRLIANDVNTQRPHKNMRTLRSVVKRLIGCSCSDEVMWSPSPPANHEGPLDQRGLRRGPPEALPGARDGYHRPEEDRWVTGHVITPSHDLRVISALSLTLSLSLSLYLFLSLLFSLYLFLSLLFSLSLFLFLLFSLYLFLSLILSLILSLLFSFSLSYSLSFSLYLFSSSFWTLLECFHLNGSSVDVRLYVLVLIWWL